MAWRESDLIRKGSQRDDSRAEKPAFCLTGPTWRRGPHPGWLELPNQNIPLLQTPRPLRSVRITSPCACVWGWGGLFDLGRTVPCRCRSSKGSFYLNSSRLSPM